VVHPAQQREDLGDAGDEHDVIVVQMRPQQGDRRVCVVHVS
jgi:hypothetical protein